MYGKQIDQSSMKHATMLYRCPGAELMHDIMCDYTIVDKLDEPAYNAALEDGWKTSPAEAAKAYTPPKVELKGDAKKAIEAAEKLTEEAIAEMEKAIEAKETAESELEELKKSLKDPEKAKADSQIKTAKARLNK